MSKVSKKKEENKSQDKKKVSNHDKRQSTITENPHLRQFFLLFSSVDQGKGKGGKPHRLVPRMRPSSQISFLSVHPSIRPSSDPSFALHHLRKPTVEHRARHPKRDRETEKRDRQPVHIAKGNLNCEYTFAALSKPLNTVPVVDGEKKERRK